MAKKKKKVPDKCHPWIEARRRDQLSDAHIQMARELGLNPKKFGGPANTKQAPWKLPLPEHIEELCFKLFKESRPENVRSIEQMVNDFNTKKAERKVRKQAAHLLEQSGEDPSPPQ